MKGLFRSLVAGVVWLLALFAYDSVSSYNIIKRSLHHLKTDESTQQLMMDAVRDFVVGVGLAYLFLGLLAGVLLHLCVRALHRDAPGWGRWLLAVGSLAVLATLLGMAHQIIVQPPLYDGLAITPWWADHVDPWMVDLAAVLLGLAFVGLCWTRWEDKRALARRLGALLVGAAAVVLVLRPPALTHKTVPNDGPNVVLLGIDALRPDRLGFYGNEVDPSPNIDALLEQSVVFDQAFTQLPRTYPSWTTLTTGTWPTTHGIRDNLPTQEHLVPDVAGLPAVLKDAGYDTWFLTDDSRFSYMDAAHGYVHIDQPPVNVQNYAVSANEPRYRAFHGLMHNWIGFRLVPMVRYNQALGRSYKPRLFTEHLVDLLGEASRADKFFFAAHSCVLHVPGDRVWPWHRMFGQQGYQGSNRFRYSSSGSEIVLEEPLPKKERLELINEQDNRIYDSGVAMADELVGRVVQALKDGGQWDNTIIILFSDHGENLWSPDLPYKYSGPNHGFHPYDDGQSRILFAVRVPASLGGPEPRHVGDMIRLMDIAPTVADLLHLEWPNAVDGRSVVGLMRGEEEPGRIVYTETGVSEKRYWPKGHKQYPYKRISDRYRVHTSGRVSIKEEFGPALVDAKDRVIQKDQYKLVRHAMKGGAERLELYDRIADPHNTHDLAVEHPEILAELYAELAPFLSADGITPTRFDPEPTEEIEGADAELSGDQEPE